MKNASTKIDLKKLPPEARERIQRVLHRHDYPFSIRTREDFAETWRKAADAEGLKLREWVEKYLNAAATKALK